MSLSRNGGVGGAVGVAGRSSKEYATANGLWRSGCPSQSTKASCVSVASRSICSTTSKVDMRSRSSVSRTPGATYAGAVRRRLRRRESCVSRRLMASSTLISCFGLTVRTRRSSRPSSEAVSGLSAIVESDTTNYVLPRPD
eukprot:scaffold1881_cov256-Pinguiococcus_pyrenoidosus.AAC.16